MARQFLAICPSVKTIPDKKCAEQQNAFIPTYVWAMAGDPIATAVMPTVFGPDEAQETAPRFGQAVSLNPLEACAPAYMIYRLTDRDPKVK